MIKLNTIWNDIKNGESLLSIRNKINSFNSNILNSINSINNALTVNSSEIASNTSNIHNLEHTLSSDIANNTAEITKNSNSISELVNINSYNFKTTFNVTINSTDFVKVLELNTQDTKNIGVYEYKISLSAKYTGINKPITFRFLEDNGISWKTFVKEIKYSDETIVFTHIFTIDKKFPGIRSLILEAKCYDPSETLSIIDSLLVIERKS